MSESNEAAEKRAALVRALEEERRGYEVRGLDERVKQTDEQIRNLKGGVRGRKAPGKSEA